MDELSRAYIHGQAGLDKIDAAVSGDMREAWIAQTVEQATEAAPPQRQSMRVRPAGPALRRFQARLLVLAFVVIAIIILLNL